MSAAEELSHVDTEDLDALLAFALRVATTLDAAGVELPEPEPDWTDRQSWLAAASRATDLGDFDTLPVPTSRANAEALLDAWTETESAPEGLLLHRLIVAACGSVSGLVDRTFPPDAEPEPSGADDAGSDTPERETPEWWRRNAHLYDLPCSGSEWDACRSAASLSDDEGVELVLRGALIRSAFCGISLSGALDRLRAIRWPSETATTGDATRPIATGDQVRVVATGGRGTVIDLEAYSTGAEVLVGLGSRSGAMWFASDEVALLDSDEVDQ